MFFKLLHDCVGHRHVFEHSFQFGGKLAAAFSLLNQTKLIRG